MCICVLTSKISRYIMPTYWTAYCTELLRTSSDPALLLVGRWKRYCALNRGFMKIEKALLQLPAAMRPIIIDFLSEIISPSDSLSFLSCLWS